VSEHEDENTLKGGEQDRDSFPPVSHADLTEPIGAQIGPYRLLSVLGEGGFAIVYLAEQKKPVRRQVALKVIKPGMDSKQVIARFEAERQALALLNHPNIAKVFDAGTTENGRPYFAMEYVNGSPITEQCDRDKLTIEERLELFLQVCEAVQHAHQKAIVHRDIKPSNVLVSVQGGKAVLKIIDFGVAKALSHPLTERTLFTEQGQLIGTPEYMSPEQVNMDHDIDTRTDVYSLGVLLYVLLAGVLPFDSETLRKGGIDHIRRTICEEDPETPSTRLSTIEAEKSTRLAQQRQTNVRSLRSKLHRELDWITAKAMEKDPGARYQSATELRYDVQCWLNGDPIAAKSVSSLYLLRKIIARRRHTSTVASLLVMIVSSCLFTLYFYWRAQAVKATQIHVQQREEGLKTREIFTDRRILIAFLELWHAGKDHIVEDPNFLIILNPLSPERAATEFLLDHSELDAKKEKIRGKFGGEQASFWHFIVGECCLKQRDNAKAREAYESCLAADQASSKLDKLFVTRAQRKLKQLGASPASGSGSDGG
jgi:serine/threonine protein kinase